MNARPRILDQVDHGKCLPATVYEDLDLWIYPEGNSPVHHHRSSGWPTVPQEFWTDPKYEAIRKRFETRVQSEPDAWRFNGQDPPPYNKELSEHLAKRERLFGNGGERGKEEKR